MMKSIAATQGQAQTVRSHPGCTTTLINNSVYLTDFLQCSADPHFKNFRSLSAFANHNEKSARRDEYTARWL